MRAPAFWYSGRKSMPSLILTPASWVYSAIVALRNRMTTGHKTNKPVICIGNLVAGGAGKTPTALALAALLKHEGKSVSFLTRGYGGNLSGPIIVTHDQHTAKDVGDEALLLAESSSTMVARNRVDGAEQVASTPADYIIMDDGFQNPSLIKDLSLIVIDRYQGIGNGKVIPAGPLRAALNNQIANAHGFIIIGGKLNDQNLMTKLKESGKPIFSARIKPTDVMPDLTNRKIIAYTGIGMPRKFFSTLKESGAEIVERVKFPDHHPFSQSDADWLLKLQADTPDCLLVTTAKDHIRLKDTTGACAELYLASLPYCVDLKFSQEAELMDFITKSIR